MSFRNLYTDENGALLKTGDIVKFENLSKTLEMIAEQGPDVFYNGTRAKNLISDRYCQAGFMLLSFLTFCKPGTMI